CSCDAEPLLDTVQTRTQMAPIELLEQHVGLAPERLLVLRLARPTLVVVRLVHGEVEVDRWHVPDAPGLGRGAISVRPAAAEQVDEAAQESCASADDRAPRAQARERAAQLPEAAEQATNGTAQAGDAAADVASLERFDGAHEALTGAYDRLGEVEARLTLRRRGVLLRPHPLGGVHAIDLHDRFDAQLARFWLGQNGRGRSDREGPGRDRPQDARQLTLEFHHDELRLTPGLGRGRRPDRLPRRAQVRFD